MNTMLSITPQMEELAEDPSFSSPLLGGQHLENRLLCP